MVGDLKSKKQSGFTIIEVLIVLAIAGLIMLIVFMAVPSLQRNSRNNQRTNDASQVVAAVNECLNNKNGVYSSCTAVTDSSISVDPARLNQLKDVRYGDWNALGGSAASGTATGASIWFGYKCTADGSSYAGSSNQREFMVLYRYETANGGTPVRCLGS
jgi:prepilin-type N-terminal cleavage/methylation domain-containing protein